MPPFWTTSPHLSSLLTAKFMSSAQPADCTLGCFECALSAVITKSMQPARATKLVRRSLPELNSLSNEQQALTSSGSCGFAAQPSVISSMQPARARAALSCSLPAASSTSRRQHAPCTAECSACAFRAAVASCSPSPLATDFLRVDCAISSAQWMRLNKNWQPTIWMPALSACSRMTAFASFTPPPSSILWATCSTRLLLSEQRSFGPSSAIKAPSSSCIAA
mmetsp:Transcript_62771/g.167661  ORF Transcript_62771/g.167661 Transcript_62771/m.167661 type:complete len:222 (+) Transcript_62771:262-927(+)